MKCLNPISIRSPDGSFRTLSRWISPGKFRSITTNWLSVPCGKCEACLSSRRQQWAFRLEKEKLWSDSALFITLTYDEVNAPIARDGSLHVSKRDCQLFMKKLRKKADFIYAQNSVPPEARKPLRYYLTSEYGPETFRPHYHLLLFNLPFESYDHAYKIILETWNKGVVQVGPLEDGGGSYAAKYILHPFEDLPKHLTKPFSLMSRRPGIGIEYLTPAMIGYFQRNKTYLTVQPGGYKVPLPRYYRKKIFDDETLKEISQNVIHQVDDDTFKTFESDLHKAGRSLHRDRQENYRYRISKSLKERKNNGL